MVPAGLSLARTVPDDGLGRFEIMWIALLLAGTAALYGSWLGIGPYADDFQFAFADPATVLSGPLRARNADNMFYRPLEAVILAATQARVGLDPRPVHIVAVALHAALSVLVFAAMRRVGLPRLEAAVGSLFLAISQANVHAVLSYDTLSQVGATSAATLAAVMAAVVRPGMMRGLRSMPICGMVAASLLFKETGVSAVGLVATVRAVRTIPEGWTASAARRWLVEVAPVALLLCGYLVLRAGVLGTGPAFGRGRYDFHLGWNVPGNLALLGMAGALPVSTVEFVRTHAAGRSVELLGLLAAGCLFVAMIATGMVLHPRRFFLTSVGCLGVIALFPMVLLNHVSELYLYNAMPWLSVIVGAGAGRLLARARNPATRVGIALLLFALGASHIHAIRGKAGLMERRGIEAKALLGELAPWAARVPPGGTFVLVNPAERGPRYSVFLMEGFDVVSEAPAAIARLLGRPDVRVVVVEREQPDIQLDGSGGIVVTLQDGRVTPITAPSGTENAPGGA